MSTLKISIIGCGAHSRMSYGPVIRKISNESNRTIRFTCCDLDKEKARDYKKEFNLDNYFTDIDEMIDEEKPDGIILVVPLTLTCSIAQKILKTGIPLMLEKPPGATVAETKQLIAAAKENQSSHMVAFNRRSTPLIKLLKKKIFSNFSSGDIQYIRYDFARVNRSDPQFYTTAIHGIDAVRFLADSDYRDLSFHYQEMQHINPGAANICVQGKMVSGALTQLNFMPMCGILLERVTINVENHTFMLNIPMWGGHDAPGDLYHYENDKLIEHINGSELYPDNDLPTMGGFYDQMKYFIESIKYKTPLKPTVADSLQSMIVAEHIDKRKDRYLNLLQNYQ